MGVLTNINYNTNMEITPEQKAKVFAQYLGHKCTTPHGWTTVDCVCIDGINLTHEDPIYFYEFNTKLLLRPLSAITDEDAIEVGKIQFYDCSLEEAKKWLNRNSTNYSFSNGHLNLYIYQYLQSKGYALPYLQYSVEDLVKAGIYQLTE